MELNIKICGMREPANIKAVGKLEPDYMGFIFYDQSKRFAADVDKGALSALPALVKKTGIFVNASLEEIEERISEYDLDVIQLHGEESPDFCLAVRRLGVDVIKAFGLDDKFDFKQLKPYTKVVDFFLFDTKSDQKGGSGIAFNWEILKKYSYNLRYFLSGGISASSIGDVLEIKDPRLYGVDLNSCFELEPGLKDAEQLKSVFAKIRTAVDED